MDKFKYKNTIIKITKPDVIKVRAQSCPAAEESLRGVCATALKKAMRKKLCIITFGPFEFGKNTLTPLACAKIIAQEAYKHIKLTPTSLKEIIIAVSDGKALKLFSKTVFSYLDYIINKLSCGPFSTVDIIIEIKAGIVLIERSNPPFGWAIPGGFVDYGESIESTAVREAKEETGLKIFGLRQFHTYSKPGRDPRFQTITTVFSAQGKGVFRAASDAKDIGVFNFAQIRKMKLAFDHNLVIEDYFKMKPKLTAALAT